MKVAHCANREPETVPTQFTQFEDGEQASVGSEKPPLKIAEGFGANTISHRFGSAQVGVDKAAFASADAFAAILEEHDLPEQPIVVDTSGDNREPFEFRAYVWVNNEVLLVTKYNPLTGRGVTMHDCQLPEPGLAHYMGIEGTNPAVTALTKTVSRRLSNGYVEYGERGYI